MLYYFDWSDCEMSRCFCVAPLQKNRPTEIGPYQLFLLSQFYMG